MLSDYYAPKVRATVRRLLIGRLHRRRDRPVLGGFVMETWDTTYVVLRPPWGSEVANGVPCGWYPWHSDGVLGLDVKEPRAGKVGPNYRGAPNAL